MSAAQALHPMLRGVPEHRQRIIVAGLRAGVVDPHAAGKLAEIRRAESAALRKAQVEAAEACLAEKRQVERQARIDAEIRAVAERDAASSARVRIVREVCEAHGVARYDVLGPCRVAKVVTARHELCYRLVAEAGLSFAETGRRIGRDHTSVIHGARQHAYRNGLPEVHGRARSGRVGC